MRKLLAALALAAIAAPGIAPAATFSGTFDISGDAFSDPGLVVKTLPKSGPFSVDLNLGEWKSVKLFRIWTDESDVGADDKVPNAISVLFDVLSHGTSGSLGGTVTGYEGIFEWGEVTWNNPLTLNFGPGGSGQLSIWLTSAIFNKGLLGLKEGKKHGADIYAEFKYEREPQVIPLPAGLLLVLTGTGAVGLLALARRRPA